MNFKFSKTVNILTLGSVCLITRENVIYLFNSHESVYVVQFSMCAPQLKSSGSFSLEAVLGWMLIAGIGTLIMAVTTPSSIFYNSEN